MTRRCLVVSAVNFTEGGPLEVLRNFVRAACETLSPEWEIVVFLHDRKLIGESRPQLIEVPTAKASWLRRLWIEWIGFRRHAERLQPDLWVSLHDISPNVGRTPQAVYCHNPVPFYPLRWRDVFFQPSHLLFHVGYGWLYRVNLRRNSAVVVQQQWLRDAFRRWTGPAMPIVVAHPEAAGGQGSRSCIAPSASTVRRVGEPAVFVYPALPRPFKNMELIGEALRLLESAAGWHSTVVLTVDGTENRYAGWLRRRFGSLGSLQFVGLQTREAMRTLYARADCLLFPSRMETWGLPISEARQCGLPMLVADLPYARETVGSYSAVEFVAPADARALAEKLLAFQDGRLRMTGAAMAAPAEPFASGWRALIQTLLGSAGCK